MAWLLLAGAASALGYAAFQYGGVLSVDWNVCLLILGISAAVSWSVVKREASKEPSGTRRPDVLNWLIAALAAVVILQLIPFPLAVLQVLSPQRAELVRALQPLGMAVDWAPLSVKPAATWQHLSRLLGYIAVFLMVRDVARRYPEKKWLCMTPLLAVALFEAGLGLVQGYLGGAEMQARGTYVNRNHFAGLLEMCLPFPVMYAMGHLAKSRKRFESPAGPALVACGALSVAAVILLGAVLSLSRMGFLATLFGLLVTGLMAAPKRWVGMGLLAVLGVAGVALLPSNALLLRFGDLAATEDISGDTRAQIWHDTWGLIESYPLTGAGLGTFESAFLRHQRVAPMNTIDYAHNDYMQVMAELGIPGLLLMLAIAARLVWVLSLAGGPDRWLAMACMGSLAAIGLHSFVDYNLYIPANAMVLAWVAAIAEGVD